MEEENYNVIAVMSGTSLDGADLAHVSLAYKDAKWAFKIAETATVPYTDEWVQTLKAAVEFTHEQLEHLNKEYTTLLAGIINGFIREHGLANIDAICSHGHTIQHRPQDGYTLQIGNLPEIATLTGHKVICDFRVQDVELGGQGAPLVPIGDRLLFGQYRYCLNLGGFSNISFEEGQDRIAFDICPVNTVLNFYANRLGFDYDDGGSLASNGNCIPGLLEALNSLQFYSLPYPKSLGFEFVKEMVLPLMEKYDTAPEDKLRTFTEHIAFQIAEVIKQKGDKGELLVTGGGAYNTLLINRMKALLPDTLIYIPDDTTIQFKEALIFALLGVLKLRNEDNVLSSVTGAEKDHSSGRIYLP
ncbi:anhydro-N-acetylmuramic acid kinase [Flavobacterium album]|uniref:Anhydro-N-acetylmuramic acid kinase n=1 Tax=Flavobacterium album TaxID=2175091 RepID=A0A2S1R2A7_9FLAO|nr:anhydro-N-acetylmuramic acid kinase [Flavobacterium album]AWH86818.1 anhydro-N-acetylmuramic acid kinase [Flavobacterium album]